MADLTRFDFHAKKFYFSEDVQVMSAEEVGQYLLLLVSAWLGGKDATLPDNPILLARAARVSTVSELVLAKFPLVETEYGPRRRNETLYEEWMAATSRSETASQNGGVGGRSRSDAKIEAARINGKSGGRPAVLTTQAPSGTQAPASVNPSETQSQFSSVQTDSIQSKPITGSGSSSFSQETTSKPLGGDWKNLAIRHKRVFGTKASVAFKDKYFDACGKYGEQVVLDFFDAWAPGSKDWVEANNVANPLHLFFKKLPEEAEDAVELAEAERRENEHVELTKKKEADAIAASITRQVAENQKTWHNTPVRSEESLEDFLGGQDVSSDNAQPTVAGFPARTTVSLGEGVHEDTPADARGA